MILQHQTKKTSHPNKVNIISIILSVDKEIVCLPENEAGALFNKLFIGVVAVSNELEHPALQS